MQLTLTEKTCTKCQLTKPLSEFYVYPKAKDGRSWRCKSCQREQLDESQARRRSAMGETAWRKQNREMVARSRAKNNNAPGKVWNRARSAAITSLIANHTKEFEQLMREEKYERGILR